MKKAKINAVSIGMFSWASLEPKEGVFQLDWLEDVINSLHALNLDWKRFVTDRTVDFASHEIKAIKGYNENLPTTVNMMYYYEGLDYHKFKDIVDVISWDTYPTWHKLPDEEIAMDNGMFHDVMRTLKQKPFLLMESCPSSTNWQGVSKLKKPGVHELSSLQAVAHGSDSVLYFQIRQSQGSFEKFHGAVIDHYGKEDTRIFREVSKVGKALENIAQAEILMRYGTDFYKETAAFTVKEYEKGKAYFVCADAEQSLYDDAYKLIVEQAGVERILNTKIPSGIEITMRQSEENKFIFIQNFLSEKVDFAITQDMGDIIYGEYNGAIGAYETIVIKQ